MDRQCDNSILSSLVKEKDLDNLAIKVLEAVYAQVSCTRGTLILKNSEYWQVQAEKIGATKGQVLENTLVKNYGFFPNHAFNRVIKNNESLFWGPIELQELLKESPPCLDECPEFIICVPILGQDGLLGGLYVESEGEATSVLVKELKTIISPLVLPLENAIYISKIKEKHKAEIQTLESSLEEYKQQKKLLEIIRRRLSFSEKMADLETLLDGVIHEINNPVNFVFGNTQRLEEELENFQALILEMTGGEEEDPEILDFFKQRFEGLLTCVSDIYEGSMRIRWVLDALRPTPRTMENECKLTNLAMRLKATVRLVSLKFSESVKFECNFENLPDVLCNTQQLSQVFMNLMINGCQAIVEKQRANGSGDVGKFKISTFQENDRIGIEFQDTGCGMSSEVQSKMFAPYFTTKKNRLGTGLGLSISSAIIASHQGEITVDSRPQEGTRIVIYLPKKS